MAMLKYVKRVKKDNNGDVVLPSSGGPLAIQLFHRHESTLSMMQLSQ